MGRFCDVACYLGTHNEFNGYVDDGKPVWRLLYTKPTKKKFWKAPHLDATRAAAFEFGAASVIAGKLWDGLPAGMRRLADGGGFNRLVGHVRVATWEASGRYLDDGLGEFVLLDDGSLKARDRVPVDSEAGEFGELWDVEGLRNLDLSLDSCGPHRVDSRKFTVDSLGSEIGSKFQGLGASLGFEEGLEGSLGQVSTCPYGNSNSIQVVGLDALLDELDAARGCDVGKRTSKCVVASRFYNDGICRERFDELNLGSCHGWGKAARTRDKFGKRPVRRVRVWVHASEVVETEFVESSKRVERADWSFRRCGGYVTDWLVLEHGVASAYAIQGGALFTPEMLSRSGGTGAFVIFTAIEVSEKRGRHWVRLHFCCRMRVSDVVFVEQLGELEISNEKLEIVGGEVGRAVLVAVPGRVLEGVSMRVWGFESWEQHLGDLQEWHSEWLSGLVDGVLGGCSVEFKVSLGDNGQRVRCPYEVAGGLVRAGP